VSKSKKVRFILFPDNNRIENAGPLIKNRNFDPETRTLKKRGDEDIEMEDTVEKNVEGLAEQIIKEDAEKRAQELVRVPPPPASRGLTKRVDRIFSTLRPRGPTGTSSARWQKSLPSSIGRRRRPSTH